MSDPVLETLFDVKEDIGQVKAGIASLNAAIAKHTASTEDVSRRVVEWEMHNAKRVGSRNALLAAGSAFGAIIGTMFQVIVTYFRDRPHG